MYVYAYVCLCMCMYMYSICIPPGFRGSTGSFSACMAGEQPTVALHAQLCGGHALAHERRGLDVKLLKACERPFKRLYIAYYCKVFFCGMHIRDQERFGKAGFQLGRGRRLF